MSTVNSGLHIVSTPIGNLEDITLRALNVLKNSDIILCEDTRRSLKLLNYFKIKGKLISYHKFNEKKELKKIIEYLKQGKTLSLVSDAGTPALSDPGRILIQKCIEEGISITPIPGASSITTAISVSGFEDKFLFYGFLPKTEKELEKISLNLQILDFTLIFFIPGIKINFYITNFKKFFPNRNILIAKELTKIHESFFRNSIEKIELFKQPLKGELTIVISKKNNKDMINDSEIKKQAMIYLKKYSLKDVVDLICTKEKLSKKKVYEICLQIKNEKNS